MDNFSVEVFGFLLFRLALLGNAFIHLPHEGDGEFHTVVFDSLFEKEIKGRFAIASIFPKI